MSRCALRIVLTALLPLIASAGPIDPATGDVKPLVSDGADVGGYRLVFSDEFNGSSLDKEKWQYRTGARLLSFQNPENVSVGDGLLRIALKKEDAGNLHYTAGGVISRQQFQYGYYEARFRCPKTAGWHSAFWTMSYQAPKGGADYAAQVERGGAAAAGPAVKAQEIDICEQDSANHRSYAAGVIDWSGKSGKKSLGFGRKYYRDTTPDFAADFHVWGCEFTPTEVRFFVDGRMTHKTGATKFPHGPQNVWLTCVAALWGNPAKPKQMEDAGLPAYTDFDWVRVYEKQLAPEEGAKK